MQPAKAVGVRCINVESESALRRLSEVAHDRALATYQHAASLPGLKRVTIDCTIGSQITQAAAWLGALDRLLDLVTSVEAAGIPIHDMTWSVTWASPTQASSRHGPTNWWPAGWHAWMPASTGTARRCWRLGRSLVGNADVVLAEVQCLKLGEAKHFCIVDAAMNDLMRPAMDQAWMAPRTLPSANEPTHR